MIITSYYQSASGHLSGVTYDTEAKTFKTWQLNADQWSHTYKKNNNLYAEPNTDFVIPGDINYYHVYKHELNEKIEELKTIGFKEDNTMVLTFKKEINQEKNQ